MTLQELQNQALQLSIGDRWRLVELLLGSIQQETLDTQIDIDNENQTLHLTAQQEKARQRFRNHAGSVSLGYATGADNESIDADLAKAYSDEY